MWKESKLMLSRKLITLNIYLKKQKTEYSKSKQKKANNRENNGNY